MDRFIDIAFELVIEGGVSMRERNGLKTSIPEGGVEDA